MAKDKGRCASNMWYVLFGHFVENESAALCIAFLFRGHTFRVKIHIGVTHRCMTYCKLLKIAFYEKLGSFLSGKGIY
jgi:hypothetical protein